MHQTRTPAGERKVAQMVRVKDYDAQTNRWVVEPIWPKPAQPARAASTSGAARKPPRTAAKRSRRRKR